MTAKARSRLEWVAFYVCAVVLTAILSVVSGCLGPGEQLRIRTELQTYDWIAPLTERLVNESTTMQPQDKATHLRALKAWGDRLQQDREASTPPPTGVRE